MGFVVMLALMGYVETRPVLLIWPQLTWHRVLVLYTIPLERCLLAQGRLLVLVLEERGLRLMAIKEVCLVVEAGAEKIAGLVAPEEDQEERPIREPAVQARAE